MSDDYKVIAFLLKGTWYSADEVVKARMSDRYAYADAWPYTLASLRNRAEQGNTDLPEFIDLDTGEQRPAPRK